MRHNDLGALEDLIREAGFTVLATGTARRWLAYVSARR